MTAAIAVGVLVAAGVYLILQRGLIRITIGFVLLGHAANLLLIASGGLRLRGEPLLDKGDPQVMADPLPQAFVLTAIVISFGVTVFLLALARVGEGRRPEGRERPEPSPGDPDQPTEELAEPTDRRPVPLIGGESVTDPRPRPLISGDPPARRTDPEQP